MSLWLSHTTLMTPTVPTWLEEICQRLVDNDPSLTTVELTHPRIDDLFAKVFCRALDENTTVTTLILSCFALVDDGAYVVGSTLAKNTRIQKLQFRDLRDSREVITLFRSLLQNVSVREFSLRHCLICPRGAEALAKYFQTQTKIEEVRFVDCQFTGDSLWQICQGLKHNRALQRLFLVNTEVGAEGAAHISDMVSTSCLRELHLAENDLGDDGVAILAKGVLSNTSLRLLDIRANGVTSTGAMSLQGMISRSQFLSALCLANNELGDLGAAALARGLQRSTCVLRQLDVSENQIEAPGAAILASVLRTNRSLSTLNLSFNMIGDSGATSVASALLRNKSLRCLSLRRCGVTTEGATALAKKLPKMEGLRELVLNKNNIDRNGLQALLVAIRSNVELEYLQVDERPSEPVSREIGHWIRLNKAGRRIFRKSNVSNQLWPHVYGRISSDCDVLFHFLKQKPEVLTSNRKRKHDVHYAAS